MAEGGRRAQVIEVSSSNYDALIADGGCCISNCDSADSSKRVDRNPCTIEIEVDEKMSAPIYMYYKLTNFYQNHRRYVKSRDDMQLRGTSDLGPSSVKTNCEYRYEREGDDKSDNELLNVISPCGLIAWSLFNDSFAIAPKGGGSIDITEKVRVEPRPPPRGAAPADAPSPCRASRGAQTWITNSRTPRTARQGSTSRRSPRSAT